MLINDFISVMVPHHTAEDWVGDGRPGGTTCGSPPHFVQRCQEGEKASKHLSRAVIWASEEELSQEIKEEVGKWSEATVPR